MTAIVRRIDRVLILSDDPPPLVDAFNGVLGLPIAEPFAPRGTWASATLDAGPARIEIVRLGPPVREPRTGARLFGIAFEPSLPLDGAVRQLEEGEIAHGAPAPYPHAGELRRWTNLALYGLTDGALMFLCEYAPGHEPPRDAHPPPVSLHEITIAGTGDEIASWRRIFASHKHVDDAYDVDGIILRFKRGPSSIERLTFSTTSAQHVDALHRHAAVFAGLNLACDLEGGERTLTVR